MPGYMVVPIALSLVLSGAATTENRAAQARFNYQALLNGTKQLSDLSLQEQNDIVALDRYLREHQDKRTPSQRCVDGEMERAGGSVTRLERRIIDMKCREAGD